MISFQKLILPAAVAACLAFPQETIAGGSARLNLGHKNTSLDLKVSAELAPDLKLFIRQIPSVDYDNKVSHFGLISLGYNLVDSLNVVLQAQAITGKGAAPRLGLEYFKQIGELGLYGQAVSTIQDDQQIELTANAGYRPKLTDNLRLVTDLEAVTLLSPERGHDYSTQRLILGLGMEQFEFGPSVKVKESAGKVNYNLGGSVKLSF